MPMGASSVYLTRDEEYIYIDGVRFYIETLGRGERQTLPSKHGNVSGRDFFQELEELSTGIKHRTDEIVANILVSDQDKKEVTDYAQRLFVEIAHTRQDLEKLEG
jgi:MoxR-like ATPase